MKKYIKNIALFALMATTFIGCSDYLDVQPEDKFLEEQVYSTESGINNLLNGIYLNLAGNDLYGGRLTMSTVEALAQRYSLVDTDNAYYNLGQYSYEETNVETAFNSIWTNAYQNILSLNDFIANVPVYQKLTIEKQNTLMGEAYALRALLHFDLLRLFGPIYSENPDNSAIPYYSEAKAEGNPVLTGTEVLAKVKQDLDTAVLLLQNDPLLNQGPFDSDLSQPFYGNRNLRLNLYAAKGLQARVYLYEGNNPAALTAAKFVIDEASPKFPWIEPDAVLAASDSPDRAFSTEILFALQNLNLYARHRSLFSANLTEQNILVPNSRRLGQVYEENENDYRYNPSWIIPLDGAKTYRTFYKYSDIEDTDLPFRFMQPMVRMSEMYYIAAETETNPTLALQYLNTVRFNRGLTDLPDGTDLTEEIRKEYMKEFYGEGQLFYYYKRKNIENIPDGNSTVSSRTVDMDESKYVLPLPDSETRFN